MVHFFLILRLTCIKGGLLIVAQARLNEERYKQLAQAQVLIQNMLHIYYTEEN